MKRALVILLTAGVMTFACVGCGSSSSDQAAEDTQTEAVSAEEESEDSSAETETETEEETSEAAEETEESADAESAGDAEYDVEVDFMGDPVEVHVVISDGGSAFAYSYSFSGNDVTADGTIGEDGTWTLVNDSSGFGDTVVPLVQEAVEALQ